jgi:hypothetical protein
MKLQLVMPSQPGRTEEAHASHACASPLGTFSLEKDTGRGRPGGFRGASALAAVARVAARGSQTPPLPAQSTTGVRGALAQFPNLSAILECSPKVLQPSVVLGACGKHYLNRLLGGSRALWTH